MCDFCGLSLYAVALLVSMLVVYNIKTLKLFGLSILLLIVLFSAFRGTAGVDTPLYIIRFESEDLTNLSFIEPVVPLLMYIVKVFGGTFPVFSLIYGSIVATLYYIIFKKYPTAVYFGVSVFPVIYIDSLFNGIRIGLAYPLLFLSIAMQSLSFLILSSFCHVSSIFGLFFGKFFKYAFFMVITLIILLKSYTISDLLPYRYISKMDVYSGLAPPTSYAGIADSVGLLFSIVIYIRASSVRGVKFIIYSMLTSILILLAYYYIVREYTAALRIIRLTMICFFGLTVCKQKKVDKISLYISLIFGFAYILNFLRQIAASCSYPEGGFIPLNLHF